MSFLKDYIQYVSSEDSSLKDSSNNSIDQSMQSDSTNALEDSSLKDFSNNKTDKSVESDSINATALLNDQQKFKLALVKAVEKEGIIYKYKATNRNRSARIEAYKRIAQKILNQHLLNDPNYCKWLYIFIFK